MRSMHPMRNASRTRSMCSARCSAAAPRCGRSKCWAARSGSLRLRDGCAERPAGRGWRRSPKPTASTSRSCALGRDFGRRFTGLLQRLNVDVLHSHVHYASGYLLWLAKRAGVQRRIAHFRNTSDGQGNGLRRRAQRAVMRRLIESVRHRHSRRERRHDGRGLESQLGPSIPAAG